MYVPDGRLDGRMMCVSREMWMVMESGEMREEREEAGAGGGKREVSPPLFSLSRSLISLPRRSPLYRRQRAPLPLRPNHT